jgi:Amt family ammonium transporter
MDPQFALVTGLISGIITYIAPKFIASFKIDDVVDAVSVHGFCGAWGTLAAGIFFAGDLFSLERFSIQGAGVLVAFVWGFGVALICYYLIDKIVGSRCISSRSMEHLQPLS